MKKNVLFLSLGMLLVASNSFAARLTITNNSNKTIWARINDQKMKSLSPEEMKVYRHAKLLAFLAAPAIIPVRRILKQIDRDIKNAPAFKKIKPDTKKVFHSGIRKPIKKVTFLRVVGSKTERMERKALGHVGLAKISFHDSDRWRNDPGYHVSMGKYENPTMNELYNKYGNMYAVERKIEGIPRTLYVNMYNNISEVYTKPNIDVVFPVVETFKIQPKIKALNLNAKVKYNGWKKAKRIKK